MDAELPFPPKIDALIAEHHCGGITESDCLACSSFCCSQAGFAILENVLLIYERYRRNELQREDYVFEPGQSFRDFVYRYFDAYLRVTGRWWSKKEILVFHVKSLSSDGHVITVPAVGYYYDGRMALFRENPWLNAGCAFLSKKLAGRRDDGNADRHCILHTPASRTHLTAKPIDCVLFTCSKPLDYRTPTKRCSARWFRALVEAYPDSRPRFRALVRDAPADADKAEKG